MRRTVLVLGCALVCLSFASAGVADEAPKIAAASVAPATLTFMIPGVTSPPVTWASLSCIQQYNACIAGCDGDPYCDPRCTCDYYYCKGLPLPPDC